MALAQPFAKKCLQQERSEAEWRDVRADAAAADAAAVVAAVRGVGQMRIKEGRRVAAQQVSLVGAAVCVGLCVLQLSGLI